MSDDVISTAAPEEQPELGHLAVWGPVDDEEATAVGAVAEALCYRV